MKHLFLIAIAFVTLQTTAQVESKQRHKDQNRGHKEMMKNLSPEERATIKTKQMTLALDLNDSQQSQVNALLLQDAKDRQKKMEARKAQKKVGIQEPSKEEYVKHVNEKLDHQIEMKAQMKKILTNEQFKKWESDQAKRHKREKNKHAKKQRQ